MSGEAATCTGRPIVIALVSDVHERQADGRRWLCAPRNFDVLFAGGTRRTHLKVDTES